MLIEERQRRIIEALRENPQITVKELAKQLCFSEPTIRRDFTELHKKGVITKLYGGAVLNQRAADGEIPFAMRENEKSSGKSMIGKQAARLVQDGAVIMLDGSTSAYHLVPYIADYKDIIVITSGAKTAVALAERDVTTFSTGGKMIVHSFSYVGQEAEDFVRKINADVLFFSCRGVSEDGMMSDPSVREANLRRVMMEQCKKKYLLCDGSKFGKTFFYNMGNVSEIDGIISDVELPEGLRALIAKKEG
ncbi:MAG: DeoR/GlpR transcriptional regulator [Clostridia bacterium]|nr:DeoR/GlpR transcriptional regulator [Clostridia bacterium]